jgi:hypothetical protein
MKREDRHCPTRCQLDVELLLKKCDNLQAQPLENITDDPNRHAWHLL